MWVVATSVYLRNKTAQLTFRCNLHTTDIATLIAVLADRRGTQVVRMVHDVRCGI